jgi:hypothetical protein
MTVMTCMTKAFIYSMYYVHTYAQYLEKETK